MSQAQYPPCPIFGQSNSMQFKVTSVRGESGWFTVPPGFSVKPNPTSQQELIVSPNADFSPPVYYACMSDDMQTYAFQDLWLQKLLGIQ